MNSCSGHEPSMTDDNDRRLWGQHVRTPPVRFMMPTSETLIAQQQMSSAKTKLQPTCGRAGIFERQIHRGCHQWLIE